MSNTPQRLDVHYRIVWESDWHAGSGESSAGIDRRVRRRGLPAGSKEAALPFLPGSQLKGVLRHQCERLAALLDCAVVQPHYVGRADRKERPEEELLLRNFRPLARSGLVIDRLFGSRYQGDCLFVDDALPEGERPWPSRVQARTAIDRLSGTAREHTLFVSEIVSGSERALAGTLRARHPAGVLTQFDGGFPLEYSLLLAGLGTLDSLGGSRSAGLGRCRIEVLEQGMRWNGEKLSRDAALGSFEEGWKEMLDLAREGGTA